MLAQFYSPLQMNHINVHSAEVVKRIAAVEGHTTLLKGQLQQSELHWNRAIDDNVRLHQQIAALTARLEVCDCSVMVSIMQGLHGQPLVSSTCLACRRSNNNVC